MFESSRVNEPLRLYCILFRIKSDISLVLIVDCVRV